MTRPQRQSAVEVLDIVDLSHDGRGVARAGDGKTVFIDDVLPGESVEIQRLRRKRGFDEARLVRVVQPSATRVEPRCPHFGMCGGCALQHLDAAHQLDYKQHQLLENLARIGKVTPDEVLPPLSSTVWNYRRRARLGVRWVPGKSRSLVGFRERNSAFLANLTRCEVLAPPLDGLIEPLSALISSLSLRARIPQVEASVADNGVALVIRVLDPPTPEDLQNLRTFAADRAVQIFLQPGGYETIVPLDPPARPLAYRLPESDVELEFGPADFIQVNGGLNRLMVAQALRLLDPQPGDAVLDLFCGLGNFSLPLARRAGRVVGIEGDAALVERARCNALRNGLANTRFIAANLFEEQLDSPWARERYQRVLLDPPRAGAREILPAVARSGASRLVYISCHPGSLARDAGILVHEQGFRLTAAGVMDMFPHTAHVESVAVFDRS